MIKLAAFDPGGTIGDTIPMCIKAFRQAVSPYAGHLLTDRETVETFGLNEAGMIRRIVRDHQEQALRDFYARYEELHEECPEPYDGIRELLAGIRTDGKPLEPHRLRILKAGCLSVLIRIVTACIAAEFL